MGLLKSLEVKNFMCFRDTESINLSQGTFLIGVNNAGKTVLLLAIRCFFDESIFCNETFLNKTEFAGKSSGYNKSLISIDFNLSEIRTKSRQQRLVKQYGATIKITKLFTYRDVTKTILVEYEINGDKIAIEKIDPDVQNMLDSVRITYLHPQEGDILLKQAQKKLKDRLLLNWGRKGAMTKSMQDFKESWNDLRKNANIYLSKSLTESLKTVWPGSTTKINLPKSAEDIIAISDISFLGNKNLPEIQITSQGVGAQSMILYFTHFLLDTDRSLHRGEYNPVWLLEEPESFLHADLAFKFGNQISSESWLNNIQMVISTHSPIILASSRQSREKIHWNLIDNNELKKGAPLTSWGEQEIKNIGSLMGDSNFYVYFLASAGQDLIFIEDKKQITSEAFSKKGIDITKALHGVQEINKYIDALSAITSSLICDCYFIVDADKGVKEFTRYTQNPIQTDSGFSKYKITDKVFLVVLPEKHAVEDLFDEFDNFLEERVAELFSVASGNVTLAAKVRQELSRVYVSFRGKPIPSNKEDAKLSIKNHQDIKDLFWEKVKTEYLLISNANATALKNLIC